MDRRGVKINFPRPFSFNGIYAKMERDLQSAGWRIVYAANRRAQAIPSLVYWKANFDRVFAKRMPPGHLGAHYRYTRSALASIIEWCRTFPLLDVVAD